MSELKSASFKEKDTKSLPKGAKVTSKEVRVSVEEIENGFLIVKSADINYTLGKETNYFYLTKKYFSKDNPLSIDLDDIPLADKID